MKGLPGQFRCKADVEDFISQTLWIVVHHAVHNNPMGTGYDLIPNKLYLDPRATAKKEFVYMLPGAMQQVVCPYPLSISLSSSVLVAGM